MWSAFNRFHFKAKNDIYESVLVELGFSEFDMDLVNLITRKCGSIMVMSYFCRNNKIVQLFLVSWIWILQIISLSLF